MKNWLVALLLSVWTSSALAAAPQPGLWWSPSESGRGYSIDSQGGTLVLTVFAYGYDGRMQWYYADGPLSADGTQWQGTLLKFDNGQPMNGAYSAPTAVGNDGPVFITFSSRTTANITLPGGRTHAIERQNFGVGAPPNALLGEWLFAYSIGTLTFANRYLLTKVIGATATGNGIVSNSTNTVAAEYQTVGSLAGQILTARFSSTGAVLDTYVWTLQLEEGRGSYLSLSSGARYGLNVYKTHTPTGMSKNIAAIDEDIVAGGGARPEPKGLTLDEISTNDPELGRALRGIWKKVFEAGGRRPVVN